MQYLKNLTKFSYVEIDDLFDEFKDEILVRSKSGATIKQAIPKIGLLKEKEAVSFCDGKKDFRERVKGKNLIKNNKWVKDRQGKFARDKDGHKILRKKGIPQGSPISATLANIYMIEFDTVISNSVRELGGLYQRYSDDMVAIVEEQHMQNIIDLFQVEITKSKLDIQPSKTQIFFFKEFNGKYGCREYNINTRTLSDKYKFDYLGIFF